MNYELYHYGVKGMKWGVRKSINRIRDARDLARYNRAMRDKQKEKKLYTKIKPGNSFKKAHAMAKAIKYKREADKVLKQLGKEKVSKFAAGVSDKQQRDARVYETLMMFGITPIELR